MKTIEKADISFDEFNLDIDIHYDGTLIEIPAVRPEESDLMDDEKSITKLSGFLIGQYAYRVKSGVKDGHCHVQFHFDH